MRLAGLLIILLTLVPAHAGNSGTLFLRAFVPSRFNIKLNQAQGSFRLESNTGKFSLATHIEENLDPRGFRIITVIPQ